MYLITGIDLDLIGTYLHALVHKLLKLMVMVVNGAIDIVITHGNGSTLNLISAH
jgi:carbamate kinase